jgi:hypothetical protein
MEVQRIIRRCARPFLSGVLGLSVIVVLLLTANPALHHLLHRDASSQNHHCLACALLKGQVDLADPGRTASSLPVEAGFSTPPDHRSISSSPDYRNSPTRAPPVS